MDERGAARWSGHYGSFGEVRLQRDGFTRKMQNTTLPHQPLRYAGQYAESDTGLPYIAENWRFLKIIMIILSGKMN